jgi:hypothetical protein
MTTTQGFIDRLDGRFEGILAWERLDALWQRLKQQPEGWYFYQVGAQLPDQPLPAADLPGALDELDQLLRREHDYDYCGIVYVDDPNRPTLIKVYDPNNLGSSCGCGGGRIPPRWVISREPPQEIRDEAPTPNNRKRWWSRLFARK